ncbi:hypothetical protein [Amycolatopsis taiwanensis]|uniref:IrrE N-terminal-like domain-containing protein n=1 Tax=Amycolatopsis taiwanensis TaxID=342230 RepID=A0A9W6R4I2_9PSEU|nr:hypothetical protein [Amycolatopsis taiwanensis]GLY68761.1 hypothetical protein Atai01_53800 [Amycolatopsis taiwanensis]
MLTTRLAQRQERDIKLVPYPLPAAGAFGLWIGTADTDFILYQRDTTPAHQEHIILHEIGHIVSGHGSVESDESVWSELFPDIPPELIRRALRREGYGPGYEREAEMVATVIKEWATLLETLKFPSKQKTDAAQRLRGAFDDHQGWL